MTAVAGLLVLVALTGCTSRRGSAAERAVAARALFEQTAKNFHLPSAEARGVERERLERQAMSGYEQLLAKYSDQDYWAAQALRSLGNLHASRTNLTAAVKCYDAVEKRFPRQTWEILMARKSAADLLWESGRRDEAKEHYRRIVAGAEGPDASPLARTIIRGSLARIEGRELAAVE